MSAPAPSASGAIAVVDYHKGNLSSVARGLTRAGAAQVVVTDDPAQIRAAAGVVLPGVGSFYDAIAFMTESGEAAAVLDAVGRGVPFLGICLGLQLLYERGDEGVPADAPLGAADGGLATVFEDGGHRWVRGLGVLEGASTLLDAAGMPAGRALKVPHVGWDQVHVTAEGRSCPLLSSFPEGANMYFTHSYAVDGACADEVAARTHYVRSFPCIAWRGNVFGCQFHPEKSSGRGLDLLRNFVHVVEGAACGDASDEVTSGEVRP